MNFVSNIKFYIVCIIALLYSNCALQGAAAADVLPAIGAFVPEEPFLYSGSGEEESESECECAENYLYRISTEDWLKKTMKAKDFIFIAAEFIKFMCSQFKAKQWLNGDCPHIPLIIGENRAIFGKVVTNSTTYVVGDIHAKMRTVEDVFNILLREDKIDTNMNLKDNANVVFLGDYCDRGGSTLKAISTLMLFAIKNKGHVFLLRGNHEDINTNLQYRLDDELDQITKHGHIKVKLKNSMETAYEYMITALLLGRVIGNSIKYFFLAHACTDIRFNYANFLDFRHDAFMLGNGCCFWNVKKENITDTFIEKIEQHQGISPEDSILTQKMSEPLAMPSTMDDIDLIGRNWFSVGYRGAGSIILHPGSIRYFWSRFDTQNYSVDVIIHGHAHHLPKILLGQVYLLNPTPGLRCDFAESDQWFGRVLTNQEAFDTSKRFINATLISGSINLDCYGKEAGIIYNTTIGELSDNGSSIFLRCLCC